MNVADMEYLTTRQAAELAGVSQSLIQKEISRGQLAAARFGRDNMVLATDLDAWRKQSRQPRGRPPIHGRRSKNRSHTKST